MPHFHRDIDFTVDVVIVYKKKVLLRHHEKYHQWLFPGGHIELHETPQDAAVREALEETGLHVSLWKPPHFTDVPNDNGHELIPPVYMNIHDIPGLDHRHQHISHVYFATTETEVIAPTYEDDRSDECLWLTAEEVQAHPDIKAQIKYYAKQALEKLCV
jgi:8-oxo-dGTP pyrophosphatase MutT (NUDIX family)